MIMNSLYYIHNPEYWKKNDLKDITTEIEALGLKNSVDAAIGEGAGGSGFETVVEVLINHPISSGVISTIIWELTKQLWKRRPKKKEIPQNIPQNYRLVIHTEDGKIIGINLDDELSEIEIAIKRLPELSKRQQFHRAYQNDDDWDLF